MRFFLAILTFIGVVIGTVGMVMLLVVNKAWVAALIWSMLVTPIIGFESPAVIVFFAVFLILDVSSLNTINIDSNKNEKDHAYSVLLSLVVPYFSLFIAWLASLAI